MEKNDNKRELMKLILNRYDLYLNAVNVKARFIVALFTFAQTMILYNSVSIIKTEYKFFEIVYLILVLISSGICFYGIYKVLSAVFPYLSSGNSSSNEYHSLLYFGSVSEFESQEKYKKRFLNRSESDDFTDLIYQVYTLSKGLNQKYIAIQTAIKFLYALGVSIILIVIIKIIEGQL